MEPLHAFFRKGIIGILLIAASVSLSHAQTGEPLPEMTLGKADAPVTVLEYMSLSCPHCAAFNKDVFPALKSKYIDAGKVRYVAREFPTNDAGLAGAVIARCLDSSRYFSFVDLLFEKQEDWAFKEDVITPLKLFAKQAGLSEEQFDKCIGDEELQKRALDVRNSGAKMGVKGVPAVFVNGKPINGAPTLDALEDAIKPYLNNLDK
jgi:protein-disulfide isomerase